MNSEFPMSFAEELNSKSKTKSNVVSLSRPQDSHLNSSNRNLSRRETASADFPMSQFDDSVQIENKRGRSSGRWLLRGFLLTVLFGLWIAIGTGRLHSDSPEVEKIRDLLSLSSSSESEELSSEAKPSEAPGVQNAESIAQPTGGIDVPTSTEINKNSEVIKPIETPEPSAASSSVVPSTVPSTQQVPAAVGASNAASDEDLKTMGRLLLQQQRQLSELEEQMTSLLTRLGHSALAQQRLSELEAQHLQAAQKLKEKRTQARQ